MLDENGYVYPGDLLAAKDPADYPREWTPDQRVSAYWIALELHRNPQSEKEWRDIVTKHNNQAKPRHNVQQAIDAENRRRDAEGRRDDENTLDISCPRNGHEYHNGHEL